LMNVSNWFGPRNFSMSAAPSILVVDNYDSFVYNLVQYMAELGAEVTVLRNDEGDVANGGGLWRPNGVLVSPGPGHPPRRGELRRDYSLLRDNGIPMFRGVPRPSGRSAKPSERTIDRAPELLHGRSSLVEHQGVGGLRGPSAILSWSGRYHSLVVEDAGLSR